MYQILYHRLVFEEDFKKFSKKESEKIINDVKKKLSLDPIAFGKPLSKELKGYYRLRIQDYRVVYRIKKQQVEVFVLKVGLRKDFIVYIEAAKRLGLI